DHICTKILKLLEEKAPEGVEERLLYDAFGSKATKVHHLNELKKNGGLVQTFINNKIALFYLSLNYHYLRKIFVN
ncbi:cardiolipin synthase, partial [Enterococcus faecalis]